jgi:hypothetical protein
MQSKQIQTYQQRPSSTPLITECSRPVDTYEQM